jgi:deoxyribose-phosphate aldolase
MTDRDELAALIEHSLVRPETTAADIAAGAQIVRSWRIGSCCVQPFWVKRAVAELAGSPARVVAVIGFPHGCDRSDVKARAAALAVEDGAAEIDVVLNYGALRSGDAVAAGADLAAVVRAAGAAPVKLILETPALTEPEKRLACRLAVDAGAAFVGTATGFHVDGGTTVHDVHLLRAEVGSGLGVKASGGIRYLADARAMLVAGANRIQTPASVAILGPVPGEDRPQ